MTKMTGILSSIIISIASISCINPTSTSSQESCEQCELNKMLRPGAKGSVLPGIEVLRNNGFEALRGLRVGLITNPTGVDNSLTSTIDILASAPDVRLTALFAPEHGVEEII